MTNTHFFNRSSCGIIEKELKKVGVAYETKDYVDRKRNVLW